MCLQTAEEMNKRLSSHRTRRSFGQESQPDDSGRRCHLLLHGVADFGMNRLDGWKPRNFDTQEILSASRM